MDLNVGDYVLVKRLEEFDDYESLKGYLKERLIKYCGKICRISRIEGARRIYFEDCQRVSIFKDDIAYKVVGNRIIKE